MKRPIVLMALLGIFLGSCASPKPKTNAAVDPMQAAQDAEKIREERDKPPVRIGPDIIVSNDPSVIWPFLSNVEDWGTWMSKVTKVLPGAGLSPGAIINWQWEEKPVQSEIIQVTENQEFDFKATASSSKVIVKWTLKPTGPNATLISLRAEVPYGTSSSVMDKLGPEMTDWISALQTALAKVPATPTPTSQDSDQ
jgi:hypothetical protein